MSAIAKDFQSLGQALQSGNLSGAQQAFTQLAQDAKSLAGATPRHHTETSDGGSSSELIQALLSSQQTASAAASSSPAVSTSSTSSSSPAVRASLDVSA